MNPTIIRLNPTQFVRLPERKAIAVSNTSIVLFIRNSFRNLVMNTISRIQKATQIFSFFMVLFSSMIVNAQSEIDQPEEAISFDHQVWSSLLNKHVSLIRDNKASEVSYQGFKADDALLQHCLLYTSPSPRDS